jgi:hypothetical protein
MEEAAHLDSESKKNTFEVRGPALSTQFPPIYDRRHDRHPP